MKVWKARVSETDEYAEHSNTEYNRCSTRVYQSVKIFRLGKESSFTNCSASGFFSDLPCTLPVVSSYMNTGVFSCCFPCLTFQAVLLENLGSTWCYLLFQMDNYFVFKWLLPDVVTQQLTINGKFSEIKEQFETLLQEKERGRIRTLYSLHFFRIVLSALELHFLEEPKMRIC